MQVKSYFPSTYLLGWRQKTLSITYYKYDKSDLQPMLGSCISRSFLSYDFSLEFPYLLLNIITLRRAKSNRISGTQYVYLRKCLKTASRWQETIKDNWVETLAPNTSVDITVQLAVVPIFQKASEFPAF